MSADTCVSIHVVLRCCQIVTESGMCRHVSVKLSNSILIAETRLAVLELLHTDRQTGMSKIVGPYFQLLVLGLAH